MDIQKLDHGATEAIRHGIARSSHWSAVRKEFLKDNPDCAGCVAGTPEARVGNEAHHIRPFHICIAVGRPDLELDPRNLINLGETQAHETVPNCHICLGHLEDFKSYNLTVREDCGTFLGMTTDQVKADARWLSKEKARPLDHMTAADLIAFRQLLDETLPPDPAILAKYGFIITAYEPGK